MKPLACGIWIDLLAPSRVLSTGRNCAPAAATAVTPTSPPSMAATNPLHHRRCMRIAVSFHPLRSRLGPTLVGRAGEPAHVTDMSITNAAHLSEPLAPNAGHQARRTAGA